MHASAEEGGHVRFTCSIVNFDKSTQVTWYLGNRQLHPSPKYEISYSNGFASIYVKDIEESDDGVYRCKVVSDDGEDSAYGELFVETVRSIREHYMSRTIRKLRRRVDKTKLLQRPPEFTLPLYNRTAYIGEDVRFGVTITVHPEPHVTWLKNGEQIKEDDRKYTFTSDKGLYQLMIHNLDIDKLKTSSTAPVPEQLTLPKEKPSLPAKILTKPQSVTVAEGETARFSCDIDGEPAPTVTWIHESKTIVSSLRIHVTTTQYKSSLEISSVTTSDEGSYTVVVENSAGRQEAHFTLTIRRPPPKEEIKASSAFSSSAHQTMMSSMMESSSFSSMAAEMKFETMSMSSMSSMTSETYAMSSSSLTEMTSHMEGTSMRAIGTRLQPLLKIEALPEDISIEPGKVLTVACAFSGDTKHIEWSRSGKTIDVSTGGRFHIETTEDLTTLIITGVKEEDAGAYTLRLSNELGSDSATVHISIRSV
uniref:Ig-like domain-containing protein n=1 Tax=Poecilia latipinna TaxID=48699 RepID=A0A3B3UX06_9TELE